VVHKKIGEDSISLAISLGHIGEEYEKQKKIEISSRILLQSRRYLKR
jgi:hypothetical protein